MSPATVLEVASPARTLSDWDEAMLRWLSQSATQGILTTDLALNIRGWNHWLEIHSGRRAAEVVGRNLLEVYPQLAARGTERYYRAALAGQVRVLSQRLHRYLLPMPSADHPGHELMAQSAQIAPLVQEGRVIGTITVIEDVTERVAHEAELQASEERYRLMFESSHDLLSVADANGKTLWANPAWRETLGYTPQTQGDAMEKVHPDDRARVAEAWQAIEQGDRSFTDVRYRYRTARGDYVVLETTVRQNLVGGEPIRYVIAHDITARVQAEAALREREEWLFTTLKSIADATIATDTQGIVTLMNPVAEELTGWSEEEALGHPLEEVFAIVNELSGERVENPVSKALREGTVVGLANHTALIARDGTKRTIADSGAPIRDREGKIIGVILVFRDISERVQTAQKLQQLYEQARREAETKANLLQEINHRVKNNLAAIIGLLYAEQRHAASENRAAHEAVIAKLINRVSGLATVHALLSASEWSPLNLSDLAGQVIRSSLQILSLDQQVHIDVLPSPVLVTPARAHNLALVINELATNSLKYALPGRGVGRIAVRVAREDHTVRLEVRDDGPGYPEEVLRLERHGVGFDLIQNIVRKSLGGELSLYNEGGAVAVIRFAEQAEGISK